MPTITATATIEICMYLFVVMPAPTPSRAPTNNRKISRNVADRESALRRIGFITGHSSANSSRAHSGVTLLGKAAKCGRTLFKPRNQEMSKRDRNNGADGAGKRTIIAHH